uniref:Uncharacterized protein n=1 Tax=Angiostrongylus cantonensis TaxID=6313 RepID=A0A0K0CXI6_ANGCA
MRNRIDEVLRQSSTDARLISISKSSFPTKYDFSRQMAIAAASVDFRIVKSALRIFVGFKNVLFSHDNIRHPQSMKYAALKDPAFFFRSRRDDMQELSEDYFNNMAYSTKFEKNIPNGHLPSRRDTRVASLNHHEPRPDSHISIQRRQSFSTERPPFQYADAAIQPNNNEPLKYISGQERVAAAIYRAETPHRELYSSGTLYRADTPNRYFPENSLYLDKLTYGNYVDASGYFLYIIKSTFAQRSETPAFPIMRETPLPFHPLLYGQNGASRQDLNHYNSMNYRSASPRSQYAGQMSRRSSLMSVGEFIETTSNKE